MDYKDSAPYRAVKKSISTSLKDRGLTDKVYTDKRDEYMTFWCTLRQLEDDIADRGVMVEDEKRGMVENRSVSLSVQVSKQMLAILKAIGISDLAKCAKSGGDDEL